ncbi:hypothetical protein ACFQ7F_18065 [Streptomyces sp. NPDC056486]|uniref:hypothetical protein n=1 Tax=Streptomyces sp. NPDC056486 TaxID=3345835 RepID=UPI003695DB7D
MARPESGKRFMGWTAAATLLAVAPLMAACSGDSGNDSGSGTSGNSGASSDKSPGAQAGGQSTVPAVVSAWVGAVIEKDAKQACLLSSEPGSGGSSPKATTPQKCASMAKKMAPGVKGLSKAFAPQKTSAKPTVKVDAPTPKGDKAVVPTAKITIDGKSLRDNILSDSHGVDPKSFTAKVKTDKINGKWYVGDFDMDMGKQTLQPKQPQKP